MLVVNGPGGAGRGEKRLSDSLCRLSVLTYSFEDSSSKSLELEYSKCWRKKFVILFITAFLDILTGWVVDNASNEV